MRPINPGTELTPLASLPALYNPRDLALIRRTVARDTTDDEFALFIDWARSLRLDPLRRQVHAFVFHKHDPKKRRLSLVTSIEGVRAIAARTGNYRPDENEPAFIADDALKAETNPAGLVSCSVDAHGQWFPITGVARWDEFAPIKTVWADNQPTDRKVLDKTGRWGDMPFLMLAKCGEAQAIRKGWPEDLSNTFVGEEIEQASLTLNPAQAAAEGATRERLERIGGHDALIIDWLDSAPLDAVPLGQLADRIVAFLRERREDHQALLLWRERNRHALREFWVRAPRCLGRQTGVRENAGAGRKAGEITQPRERHGDSVNEPTQPETPHVGIFWLVQTPTGEARLLTAGCPLDQAEPYGDCLTYGPGHYQLWAQWRRDKTVDPALRALVRSYEYEDWPRGRIVFDRSRDLFILYADRKLLTPAMIARIETQFQLPAERIEVQSDLHYQSPETPNWLET